MVLGLINYRLISDPAIAAHHSDSPRLTRPDHLELALLQAPASPSSPAATSSTSLQRSSTAQVSRASRTFIPHRTLFWVGGTFRHNRAPKVDERTGGVDRL